MRRFIFLLSLATFGFAGYTVWNDPQVGPYVQSYVPDDVLKAIPGMPVISASASGSAPDGTYGGIGAAGRVTGGVLGAVQN